MEPLVEYTKRTKLLKIVEENIKHKYLKFQNEAKHWTFRHILSLHK